MQERDLGPLGEATFKTLCHAVGLTVHKSEMDRNGWDFFVEFPCSSNDRIPQDLLPVPLECKIQVKATDKQKKRKSIKLSNLNRLVKAQMPAFFCFIEFDGEDEAQAIYLVHVEKEIIKKILKRIRELKIEDPENKLSEHTLDITYGELDKLKKITGRSLKDAIEKNVPDGLERYISRKNEILETVGFEEGKYQIKITTKSKNSIQDIVDLSLGLRKEIDIHKSIGYHKRFGMLSSNPDMNHDGGVLSIHSKPSKVIIKFKEHKFSPGFSFIAELYISEIGQFFPKEYFKLRISSRFFELIFESDRLKLLIHPFVDDKKNIKELESFLEILSIFEKSSQPIILELELEELQKPTVFSCNFSLDDFPSPSFSINVCGSQISSWSHIANIVRMVIDVCRKIHVAEEEIFVNIEDLLKLYNSVDFRSLYKALCGGSDSVGILFPDGVEGYQKGAKAASVSFAKVCIGNYDIGCCIGVVGHFGKNDDPQILIGERFIAGKQFIKNSDIQITKEQIELSLNELAEELHNEEELAVTALPFATSM